MPKRDRQRHLGLPELIEPVAGTWTIIPVSIRESAVELTTREAHVPHPYTPAQQLARMHEWGHVKYSPSPYQIHGDWPAHILAVTSIATSEKGVTPDPNAVVRISKMLEENRIDWLLWDTHGIDLRPCREVLDWAVWPDPESVLDALCLCLQLAWTVWASRGLGGSVPNLPPSRSPDAATGECFDKHWKYLHDERRDLAVAMIRGCLAMYEDPTDARRNEIAAELATFFPVEIKEKEEQPPEKAEEKAEQEQASRDEQAREDYEDAQETGVGAEAHTHGQIEYHDHTASIRRPSLRIARRIVPVSQGTGLRFPHRYLLDKSVFGQRLLTEGGLMIDGSGSMKWTDEDMQRLMDSLPAIKIGIYSGRGSPLRPWHMRPVYGRICTIAQNGRFSRYEGLDPGSNSGNDVDFEALQLLAQWPKPRLWLSDGMVCGGRYSGKPAEHHEPIGYYDRYGLLIEMCDAFMKRHDILRVPDKHTLQVLLRRQRVTLYRNCSNRGLSSMYGDPRFWPETAVPQPVTFTL